MGHWDYSVIGVTLQLVGELRAEAAFRGRELRCRTVDVWRNVLARPENSSVRACASLRPGWPNWFGQRDARGLHPSGVQGARASTAAAGGRAAAIAVGCRNASAFAVGRMRGGDCCNTGPLRSLMPLSCARHRRLPHSVRTAAQKSSARCRLITTKRRSRISPI